MRFYGFGAHELTREAAPNLDLTMDPKLAWALRHRQLFPVDLNKAPRHLLLRVPGLGTKSVERILRIRRWHKLRLEDLVRLHLPLKKLLPPAETEVFINEANGDVGLRRRGSHEYLGSFARAWVIPLGFHPFSFSLGRHTPRLRCGKVIVQRRSWRVGAEELGSDNFTGVSRDLVIAVERLHARRDLPRHIYIRPTEAALRRSGAEGRDKDTKPVYVDLESYLFLEIFHRWLGKAGELEVTETLPDPDHLLWQEKDGRRTFELRTQIIPR
ncbi:MAG: hypothetical protein H0X34_15240 [Chthoniobacterales bacterium]|nr:hypothetical protein [Chthoniobacterales bacterium]